MRSAIKSGYQSLVRLPGKGENDGKCRKAGIYRKDRKDRKDGKNRGFLFFSVLILALQFPASGLAQDAETQRSLFSRERAGEQVAEERTRISRRQASEIAREAFEGRMLSIRLERGYWRIRMDQEGKVFNVLVDANTGEVSRPSE